eukprot:18460-Rhodomonas_salina.3
MWPIPVPALVWTSDGHCTAASRDQAGRDLQLEASTFLVVFCYAGIPGYPCGSGSQVPRLSRDKNSDKWPILPTYHRMGHNSMCGQQQCH